MKRQREYWHTQFAGDLPVLDLPLDFPRPKKRTFRGDSLDFRLEGDDTAALNELARREGVTLYMVIMAAFTILLTKLGSHKEVVVGTPTMGRNRPDLEKVLGMFVNTLAVKFSPHGELGFCEYVEQVKERSLEAFENQDYPFEELVEFVESHVKLDKGKNPLFDVLFAMQNMEIPDLEIPGLTLSMYPFTFRVIKFDMALFAREEEDCLDFTFEYNTGLFLKETLSLLSENLLRILKDVIGDKNIKLKDIRLVDDFEAAQSHDYLEAGGDFEF